jgi:addiction module RelE/StbE family toxin
MKILWSVDADADNDAVFEFIAADNPAAAAAIDERIQAAVERLVKFPKMGRVGRQQGTRELIINGTPYIAVYRIRRDFVQIVRLLHGAMMWP